MPCSVRSSPLLDNEFGAPASQSGRSELSARDRRARSACTGHTGRRYHRGWPVGSCPVLGAVQIGQTRGDRASPSYKAGGPRRRVPDAHTRLVARGLRLATLEISPNPRAGRYRCSWSSFLESEGPYWARRCRVGGESACHPDGMDRTETTRPRSIVRRARVSEVERCRPRQTESADRSWLKLSVG
jgi:hypothetical protein